MHVDFFDPKIDRLGISTWNGDRKDFCVPKNPQKTNSQSVVYWVCGLVGIMAPKWFESRVFLILYATSGKKEVLTRISGGQTTENTKGFELGDFKILQQYSI